MIAPVILTVTEGPLKGQDFVFGERTTCTVGRAPCCDLAMPREDYTVSRHHCLFEIDPPEIRVRDCGSRNGTFVNGHRILSPGEEADTKPGSLRARHGQPLAAGDKVRVGTTIFRVHLGEPVDEPADAAQADEANVHESDRDHSGLHPLAGCM